MNMDELLNLMDELLDNAWSVPLSNGKKMLDVDQMRELIDDIRLNIPMEIKHAKAIVADRAEIIENANKEAEDIIAKAENRARVLISEDEIKKAAEEKAMEIVTEAQLQARQMRKAATTFVDRIVTSTEQSLVTSLTEVRNVKQEFKGRSKNQS